MSNDADLDQLLAAYLSGDILPEERAAVEQRLAEDAAFRRLSQELSETLALLKQGDRQVAPAMVVALRDRLARAALKSVARPQRATVTSVALPATVRVYTTHQSQSNRRRLWIGLAAAATVALMVGGAIIFNLMKTSKPADGVMTRNANGATIITTEQFITPDPDVIAPTSKSSSPLPSPKIAENTLPIRPKKDAVDIKQVSPTTPDKIAQLSPEKTRDPKSRQPDVARIPAPRVNSPGVEVAEPKVKHPRPAVLPPLNINNTAPIVDHTAAMNPAMPNANATASVASNSPTKTPAAENTPITPTANLAVVDSIRGAVLASTPSGVQALVIGNTLPSGTEIVTDQGRVVLALPGDGRLAINSNSSLTFELRRGGILITLNAGEIDYQGADSLTVAAGGVNITNAKSVDIKRDGNRVITAVMAKTAYIGTKGKATLVKSGFQAVVVLGGDTPPRIEAFVERPNSWTADIALPNPSAQKIPTTEIESKQKKLKANLKR
ncbi:MAG: hypothetical protein V1899_12565 [Planctomycetota bacterium]